ncbi:MAG: Fe-S protein assembly chaperone HscA [Neisseriales bacterium]|nr:MAG: Fe-S protein assembly chaperone HscA [Neisseriales bacterium]
MPLVHLTEPETSRTNLKRYAVGIDLGTTHSLVAITQDGLATCLPDENGQVLLPSVVHYLEDGSYEVGYDALQQQATDPGHTITSIKRMMGRGIGDLTDTDLLPYHFTDEAGKLKILMHSYAKSPIEISAAILNTLRKRAEKALGHSLYGAVITVPAYFDETQRQATKDAAKLAGIPLLRLLNEPTAAAIAYGLDNQSKGIFLVYDLGGGTFDVSILRLSDSIFEVIATSGDALLGGDDFDQRIYCWILEQAGLSQLPTIDTSALLSQARKAKEILSQSNKAVIQTQLSTGQHIQLTLNAHIFAKITQTLVNKTLHIVDQTLGDAKLSIQEVDGVIMVGGATYMPTIQKAMRNYYQRPLLTNLNPEKIVALGAAQQAHVLAGNRHRDWLLLDVIPLSLGIETMGELVEKIIPRNSTLPIAKSQEFTTYQDGQTAMMIHVLQGERELVADCRSLARFTLRNIPPMAAGVARIRVTFQVNMDGLLSVSAEELTTHIIASIEVKPTYGLSEADIQHMLETSLDHLHEDIHARRLQESKLNAQILLKETKKALEEDADLLTDQAHTDISLAIAELQTQLHHAKEAAKINEAQAELIKATDDFAALRMNRSIQSALKGQHINTLPIKDNS